MAEIRHILCPVDLSETSRHALDHALAIANWYDARVTVFHVFSVPQLLIAPPVGMVEELAELRPRPEEVADEVRRFAGLTAASRTDVVVVEGNPVREILDQVERLSADLLVMGTHGRSALSQMLLGSVAENVIRRAPCPVVVVRNPHQPLEAF